MPHVVNSEVLYPSTGCEQKVPTEADYCQVVLQGSRIVTGVEVDLTTRDDKVIISVRRVNSNIDQRFCINILLVLFQKDLALY